MNKQVEELYQVDMKNLQGVVQNIKEPSMVISQLNEYLKSISVIPEVKTDENMVGRKRYCSDRTSDIIVEITKIFGEEYPKEVVKLNTEVQYMITNRVCEQLNLFEYLINHMNNVDKTEHFIDTLFSSYYNCNKDIFGQKLVSSVGTKGVGYSTFINDLYSNWKVSIDGKISIEFKLEIETSRYHINKMASKFNINRSLGKSIDKINKEDRKRRKQSIPLSMIDVREQEKDDKLRKNVSSLSFKLNELIQEKYPHTHTSIGHFFKNREDVDTDYYVVLKREIQFSDNYNEVKQELIKVVKDLYNAEQEFFGFDYMQKDFVEINKKYKKELCI